jgi:hypothetical protein
MKCSKAQKLISEYIDSDLRARKNAGLEQHLDRCPGCQKVLQDFMRIIDGAKKLDRLTPSEQTWMRIKERLDTEKQQVLKLQPRKRGLFDLLFTSPGFKYALSSALLVAFIFIGAIFGLRYWRGTHLRVGEDLQKYTLAKLDEAERHYKLAIEALWKAASAQQADVDPQVLDVFRKSFEVVDSSIVTCRQAVTLEPEDINARNYLLAAYRQKLDLLNEMMEMERASKSGPKAKFKTTI